MRLRKEIHWDNYLMHGPASNHTKMIRQAESRCLGEPRVSCLQHSYSKVPYLARRADQRRPPRIPQDTVWSRPVVARGLSAVRKPVSNERASSRSIIPFKGNFLEDAAPQTHLQTVRLSLDGWSPFAAPGAFRSSEHGRRRSVSGASRGKPSCQPVDGPLKIEVGIEVS